MAATAGKDEVPDTKPWHISRANVELEAGTADKQLVEGSGRFGKVCKG